jgi:hypothetical protein
MVGIHRAASAPKADLGEFDGYCARAANGWLLPHQFPPWGTVYYYLRNWERTGTWTLLHRTLLSNASLIPRRSRGLFENL